MNNKYILVLVEGEKTEINFFNNISNVFFKQNHNIEIIPFKCNIYKLYKHIESYNFNIDLIDALLTTKNISNEEKNILINKRFFYKYLVFDFDIQHKFLDNDIKYKSLLKMKEYFSNESENGLLFLNYPMFESIKVELSNPPLKYFYSNKNEYKKHINEKINININNLVYDEILNLIRKSIIIGNYIVKRQFHIPKYEDLQDIIFHNKILIHQISCFKNYKCVYQLNTSILFLISYFGEKLFNKIKS